MAAPSNEKNLSPQMNSSVNKGQTENDAKKSEDELIKHFRNGRKGNDKQTRKANEKIDVKKDQKSLKRQKKRDETDADGELLQQSAKRRNADIKDACTEKISSSTSPEFDPESEELYIGFGENLVGSRIKVWWKDDNQFYEGVIASFYPDTKRHKVVYNDGDIEILNLRNEIYELFYEGRVEKKQKRPKYPGVTTRKRTKGQGCSGIISMKQIGESNSKQQKSATESKSKRKTPESGSRSDRKGKKRS